MTHDTVTDHLIDTLRASRPLDDRELAAGLDRQALTALREAITLTDRRQPGGVETPAPRPRLRRRTVAAGALGLALVGGGGAYAAYTQLYAGGAVDGLSCMATWTDPLTTDGAPTWTGGPALTGDPVADCQRYQELAGKPRISDPVAFTRNGSVFVAPRAEVPADGRLLAGSDAERAKEIRLDASVTDWVDGGSSRCFTKADAVPFMQSQLAEVGLTGWTTKVMPDNRPYEEGPCGFFDSDPATKTVMFFPDRGADPSLRAQDDRVAGFVYDVRDALRAGIADACVSATEAKAVATRALTGQPHWPITVVADETARCASVDLQVGGNIQVWIYGPTTAKP